MRWCKQHVHMTLRGFHPATQSAAGVVNTLHAGHDFGDQGFVFGAAAEIFIHGTDQLVLVLQHHGLQTLQVGNTDRKSTRLNSSHVKNSYAVFCLKKKKDNYVNKYVRDTK